MMCDDATYFYILAKDGYDPCDMYETCDECPYHREEEGDDDA